MVSLFAALMSLCTVPFLSHESEIFPYVCIGLHTELTYSIVLLSTSTQKYDQRVPY